MLKPSSEVVFTFRCLLSPTDRTPDPLSRHLDLGVVVPLVPAGAVVEGDHSAVVAQQQNPGPGFVILTRVKVLEVPGGALGRLEDCPEYS